VKAVTALALDGAARGGGYVLRMRVERPLAIPFGRFQGGEPVAVPAGECLYVGSATRGLERRLMRHAARCEGEGHPIQAALAARFGLRPRRKRLHWRVDYLLEETAVSLTHIIAIYSPAPVEAILARRLMADPATGVFAPGLGASDAAGRTHLLAVTADASWWAALPARITSWLGEGETGGTD
jgi:Uri superfamily endonuclease